MGSAVLGLPAPGLSFSIMVHLGTALATVVMLWSEIDYLVRGVFSPYDGDHRRRAYAVIGCVAISSIPGFLVGVLGADLVDRVFSSPVVSSVGLIITGFILLLSRPRKPVDEYAPAGEVEPSGGPARRRRSRSKGYDRSVLSTVSYGRAAVVGLAQAVAITPGISRSGTTLTAGLLTGFSREDAARFSFLMALPAVVGAAFLDYREALSAASPMFSVEGLAGAAVAFVAGMFALSSVVRTVRRGDLGRYAYYCFIAGVSSLVWFLTRG